MKKIIVLAFAAILAGCAPQSKGSDPLGPSTVAPVVVPTPAPSWTTVYTNAMNSLGDVNDYTAYSLGAIDPPPVLFSSGAHSAPGAALYQGNSDGTLKIFYKNISTSPSKIQATYWVYGIEQGLGVGIVAKFGTLSKAGFVLKINSNGSRDISVYHTASIYSSYWISLVSTPNIAAAFNVWRELKMSLDMATGLTDYYIDGVLVASSINSNNCPAILAPTLGSPGWMSVFNFAAVGGTILKVDDIKLETK